MSRDQTIVDPRAVGGLESATAIANYLSERIETVIVEMRNEPPPPGNHIAGVAYLSWRARLDITYGRALEAIVFAQAFGHISAEQFQTYKKRLLGVFLHKHTDVVAGTDPSQVRP